MDCTTLLKVSTDCGIPQAVVQHVGWILAQLNEHSRALQSVVACRGYGHNLNLEYCDRQVSITNLHQQLDEFRALATKNAVCPEKVIAALGGAPSFELYAQNQAA